MISIIANCAIGSRRRSAGWLFKSVISYELLRNAVGLFFVVASAALPAIASLAIIPTPHYFEPENRAIVVRKGGTVTIVLGPAKALREGKVRIAADFVRHELEQADTAIKASVCGSDEATGPGPHIYLWDYGASATPNAGLSFLDEEILTNSGHYGQSYVVRTPGADSIWVVGSTAEGVLLGSMTILQLIQKTGGGVEISGAYIRDYPDFQYRAAADWLMNVEVNRWALDWGQGKTKFEQVCERQLDEALRFKINMVVFDGFGWGLKQRFAGYGALMRVLNRYARARGIHLLYGGYGARYALASRGEYAGQAWKNRESYPNGPTYECMGSDMGTCRANEALNRLKAEELRKFVAAVEPGALYIHHEDVSLDEFAPMWKRRDERCRRRWPSDSVTSPEGAVGGLAHLDSELVDAINSVHNADGYDASRDCVIILVSPGYGPDSVSSLDWSETLEFWRNYALQLPRFNNIQFCFGGSSISRIFPQRHGGASWIHLFNESIAQSGLRIGSYVFFAGGADNFYSNYPVTGTPALNTLFYGASAIFNASGNFYQQPMEVINAEYSWNAHSPGFKEPRSFGKAMHLNLLYIYGKDRPSQIFGPGGIYERACGLIYGPTAGPIMASYYETSAYVPNSQTVAREPESPQGYIHPGYLPMMWNRVYAVPEYWRDLLWDSKTWQPRITDLRYKEAMGRLGLSPQELHRRLTLYWTTLYKLNMQGAKDISEALSANPRSSSVDGLRFLKTSFEVTQPLLVALVDFHRGMEQYLVPASGNDTARSEFEKALNEAQFSKKLAIQAFPDPIDPAGGEVGAIRDYSNRLIEALESMLR